MNTEKLIFDALTKYTAQELENLFFIEHDEDSQIYTFSFADDSNCYVTVCKNLKSDLGPVNADFGFSRPAGSNNYPILLDIGRALAKAYSIELSW